MKFRRLDGLLCNANRVSGLMDDVFLVYHQCHEKIFLYLIVYGLANCAGSRAECDPQWFDAVFAIKRLAFLLDGGGSQVLVTWI
jgi:hypothetical protein